MSGLLFFAFPGFCCSGPWNDFNDSHMDHSRPSIEHVLPVRLGAECHNAVHVFSESHSKSPSTCRSETQSMGRQTSQNDDLCECMRTKFIHGSLALQNDIVGLIPFFCLCVLVFLV